MSELEHISEPAKRILYKIAMRRVGRTLQALDIAGCDETLKSAVKKQFWEFKNEVESQVLGSGETNDAVQDVN